jgi:Kip1 ubiquitination-promoting complex protein 1
MVVGRGHTLALPVFRCLKKCSAFPIPLLSSSPALQPDDAATLLDEHLRAVFPSAGSGPAAESDVLLGISTLGGYIARQVESLGVPNETDRGQAFQPTPISYYTGSTTPMSPHGKIGGAVVALDRASAFNADPLQFQVGRCPDTTLESRCNFLSVRANACVFDGAWLYEATIGTAGVQQIGWVTDVCSFSNENGVGDAAHSYAFDGKRVKVWNQGAKEYGEPWIPGDVIGCGIDLTKGEVSFWRNGSPLGVASANVATGPGMAYYPALSLAFRERCRVNFGGLPFVYGSAYPDEFNPLQDPPPIRVAAYLFHALERILHTQADATGKAALEAQMARSEKGPPWKEAHQKSIITPLIPPSWKSRHEMLRMICGSHVFHHLGPIIANPYYNGLFPMVRSFGSSLMLGGQAGLDKHLALMEACLDKSTFRTVIRNQLWAFSEFADCHNPWNGCIMPMRLASCFFGNRRIVGLVSCFPEGVLHKILSGMFMVKLLSTKDAAKMCPVLWWKSAPTNIADAETIGGSKESHQARCKGMCDVFGKMSDILLNIIRTLFHDSEEFPAAWLAGPATAAEVVGCDTGGAGCWGQPVAKSPKGLFEWWVTKLIRVNLGVHRQVVPVGTSDHTVLCNIHGILSRELVDYVGELSQPNLEADVDIMQLVNDIGVQHDLPRIGGLRSHLKTEYEKELASGKVAPPTATPVLSAGYQLLDWSVMLFSLAMANPLRQLTSARTEVAVAIEEEQRAVKRLANADASQADAIEILKQGVEICQQRVMTWIRSVTLFEVAYMNSQKSIVFEQWTGLLIGVILKLEETPQFGFVPEAYLTTVLHAFTVLHTESAIYEDAAEEPYFARTESGRAWLLNYARMIVALVADKRMVCPDLNVTMIAKVKSLLGEPAYLRLVETDPAVCRGMLEVLITSYNDQRLWVPTTDILARFWSGVGFQDTYFVPERLSKDHPPGYHASKVMQETFATLCPTNPVVMTSFLNQLINHLNWTVSEFDQMLEEIRRIGDGQLRDGGEQVQVYRRCIVTYTLGVNLLRLLEGVAISRRKMLTSPQDPTNLVRVVQVLLLLVRRLYANDSLIDIVLAMKLVPLQCVKKAGMSLPMLGTLMALIGEAALEGEGPATKGCIESNPALNAIMRDGGITRTMVDLIETRHAQYTTRLDPTEPTDATRIAEMKIIPKFCKLLHKTMNVWTAAEEAATGGEGDGSDDDDNVCTICYAYPLTAMFVPCNHRSCTACIKRHLMNDTKCFFCNALIGSVVYDGVGDPCTAGEGAVIGEDACAHNGNGDGGEGGVGPDAAPGADVITHPVN